MGTFTSDKFTYKGTWVDDQMSGYGRAIYADGTIYEGNFLKNERSGKGTLK